MDNPQAFPSSCPTDFQFFEGGMTLLDYFAGQALAGYFAAPYTPHMNADHRGTAEYCYRIARAMLTARQENSND